MSTNDVPGAVKSNGDVLGAGSWAEHEDGSLIFVENAEGGRVIYSVFNMAVDPIMEYRDAMPLKGFEDLFSYSRKRGKKKKDDLGDIKWTWHDKTPFPWEKVIKAGVKDGVRYVSVDDQLNAAEKVAKARALINQGKPLNTEKIKSFVDSLSKGGKTIMSKVQRAIHELRV